jgi:hypothetical protein
VARTVARAEADPDPRVAVVATMMAVRWVHTLTRLGPEAEPESHVVESQPQPAQYTPPSSLRDVLRRAVEAGMAMQAEEQPAAPEPMPWPTEPIIVDTEEQPIQRSVPV